MELLGKANNDFDFSRFDANRDGLVDDRELSILFVLPEPHGGAARTLVNCDDAPQGKYIIVDEVQLRGWAAQWGADAEDTGTAAHELGHVMFSLPDMYVSEFSIPTEPGFVSLMANNRGTSSLLDPQQRLGLGWATPQIIGSPGRYSLEDIGYSDKVYILPRLDGRGNEYFVIENRQEKPAGHSKYDENIRDSGLGVWQVIDPLSAKSKGDLDLAPACDFGAWNSDDYPSKNNGRRGIRLIRPGASTTGGLHSFYDDTWPGLTDDPSDASCPSQAGSTNNLGRSILTWADGTPSGYTIRDVSASGRWMSFTVTVEDGGFDNDLSTPGDNASFNRTFDVMVDPLDDFGDALSPYLVTLAADGAHREATGPTLSATLDKGADDDRDDARPTGTDEQSTTREAVSAVFAQYDYDRQAFGTGANSRTRDNTDDLSWEEFLEQDEIERVAELFANRTTNRQSN